VFSQTTKNGGACDQEKKLCRTLQSKTIEIKKKKKARDGTVNEKEKGSLSPALEDTYLLFAAELQISNQTGREEWLTLAASASKVQV